MKKPISRRLADAAVCAYAALVLCWIAFVAATLFRHYALNGGRASPEVEAARAAVRAEVARELADPEQAARLAAWNEAR